MVKIAFGYKRRVGKDTSCDYLIKKYGGIKLSFAEPLYKILNYAQGVCHFSETKDRKFLQFIGTEWARTINANVWVDLLIEQLNTTEDSNVYVADLRFKNEFEVLKQHGFVCVHIKNDVVVSSDGYINHQSDLDLDNFDGWDCTIENIGPIENLYAQLDHLFHLQN